MKTTRFAPLLACVLLTFAAAAQGVPDSFIDAQVTGQGAPAIVFIPGLATPGVIWNNTAAQFQAEHACHVLTLAGFGGKPAVKTEHFLDEATDQIIAYIRAQHLERPILVGHSLGGLLAMRIALKAPEIPGRLIIVDMTPFLAGNMGTGIHNAADAKPLAAGLRSTLSALTPGQFAGAQKGFISSMVTSPEKAKEIAALTGKSDPRTTGQALGELVSGDLREQIAAIKCPVLVLAALAGPMKDGLLSRQAAEDSYRTQYVNLPQVRFDWFAKARHFIMVDDPTAFYDSLRTEMAAAPQSGDRNAD